MAQTKTKPTQQTIESFLSTIDDEVQRTDSYTIAAIMARITGCPAVMWGSAIIGFGSYHYKYASGHEGEICLVGFSPRKSAISLYLVPGNIGRENLLAKLGRHKTGKGCLYIKRLADINMEVLEQLIADSVANLKNGYLR